MPRGSVGSDVFASDESKSDSSSDSNSHSSEGTCAQHIQSAHVTEPLNDKRDRTKGSLGSLLSSSRQSLANKEDCRVPLLDAELSDEHENEAELLDSNHDYLNLRQGACGCVENVSDKRSNLQAETTVFQSPCTVGIRSDTESESGNGTEETETKYSIPASRQQPLSRQTSVQTDV